MKVLMISSDRNILTPNSAVSGRMKEYGSLVEELHIVLMSDSAHGLKDAQIGSNVWVYPTNSNSKFFRPWDASRIGKRVVFDKKFIRGSSVITAQDPFECGWAGLGVKKKWRLPLEVQLHTDPFSPYFTGFLNSIRRRMAKKVLRHSDHVRVVTKSLADLVASQTPAKISILPIYVDKERIENGGVTFDVHARYGWRFVLLAVARLEPEKNLGLAIEVLALVRQNFPDTGLLIVGSGSEERKLKSLVEKLKLNGLVEFAGWQENLATLYKTSNLFIQTSHFEGYGLALVEAGLSGLPVITTPVGLALELENGKDAYICRDGDKQAFASAIMDLIENNFKRENLQINLRRTLETKLISKKEYLGKLLENWKNTANLVG